MLFSNKCGHFLICFAREKIGEFLVDAEVFLRPNNVTFVHLKSFTLEPANEVFVNVHGAQEQSLVLECGKQLALNLTEV